MLQGRDVERVVVKVLEARAQVAGNSTGATASKGS